MATILITGGAGFIGSHTADLLLQKGCQVRILDRLDPQIHGSAGAFPAYLPPGIEKIRGDVRNPADVEAALGGVSAVLHLAALTGVGQSMYDIRDYVDTNVTGTAALLEVIVKRRIPIRRIVLASSRAVYGEGTGECPAHGRVHPGARRREDMESGQLDARCPRCRAPLAPRPTGEDRPPAPASVYARTKLQQEEYCRYAAETYGLPVTILRYFNVYGSRQSLKNPYTGIISIFYSRILAGETVSLYEFGKPIRDFVHVRDVARANVLALETDTPPAVAINIGSGMPATVRTAAETLAAAVGRPAKTDPTGEFRVGDVRAAVADVARAREFLGYAPEMSLGDGMAEFVRWAATQESEDLYGKTVEELRRHNLLGVSQRIAS
ncbi:MAG: NAD-dependent epimerase/dehydratase family protein [Planctomycetota bacterium]